jgi:uncharacterized metal-binding protein
MEAKMDCAECEDKACRQGKVCHKFTDELRAKYQNEEIKKIMQAAANIEASHYMKATRLEEIIRFAEAMDFKRLGIAFCIGLSEEARVLERILKQSFEVASVCCKVCAVHKGDFGLAKMGQDGFQAMCNPIAQAAVLEQANTQLNIMVGLCMGHDITFTLHSHAPVTTLVVKDRVLGHNPVAALYSRYYKGTKFGLKT